MGMTDAQQIIDLIAAEEMKTVDLRFTDLTGRWRHTSLETSSLKESLFEHGLMIDGSAVPGWRDISESDLLIRPDLDAHFADPFSGQPSLILYADAAEPATAIGYDRDPRSCARRAEAYLADQSMANAINIGVELGFFLFDDVRIEQGPMRSGYAVEASESRTAGAASYAGGNPGHRPAPGAAHLALPPADHHSDIRNEICTILSGFGLGPLRHEHGPSACQNRLDIGCAGLVKTADRLQAVKYAVHQVAASYGKSATFMAKPVTGEPGSPLNVRLALNRGDDPVFAGQGYADLSQTCMSFIAGILSHARALNAFGNATSNSYKRLLPDADEPTLLTYAAHNRSASIRIPYAAKPKGKRIEVRFPDPSANPYLLLTALLMAGLDGVERGLEPGDAMDRNNYDLTPDEIEGIPSTCRSLDQALDALAEDHEFLTQGEVMPYELIEGYIAVKRQELERLAQIPTPAEFELYYGL